MPFGITEATIITLLALNGVSGQEAPRVDVEPQTMPARTTPAYSTTDFRDASKSVAKKVAQAALFVPEVAIGEIVRSFVDAEFPDGVQRTVSEQIKRDQEFGELAFSDAKKAKKDASLGAKSKPQRDEDHIENDEL